MITSAVTRRASARSNGKAAPASGPRASVDPRQLVCIEGLSDDDVVLALANVRRCDEGGGWAIEFTYTHLQSALHCAKSALRECVGSNVNATNDRFLALLSMPVVFTTAHGRRGKAKRCFNAAAFDQLHGAGSARAAVQHLCRSKSTDTRHLRQLFDSSSSQSSSPVRSPKGIYMSLTNAARSSIHPIDTTVFKCRLSDLEINVQLLYALLRRRVQCAVYHLEDIGPETPQGAYQLMSTGAYQLGMDPSPAEIACAASQEIGVRMYVRFNEIRILNCPEGIAEEFPDLIQLYDRAQRRFSCWFFSVLTTIAHLLCKAGLVVMLLGGLGLMSAEVALEGCVEELLSVWGMSAVGPWGLWKLFRSREAYASA